MTVWFDKIVADDADFTPVFEAIVYFELEAADAKKDVFLKGSVAGASQRLPGIVEHRFNQLQEVEAILKHLEIKHNKARSEAFVRFLTAYNRVLSSSDANKFADTDKDVIELLTIINRVAYVRNLYLGIMKGLDAKQWQIGNLVRLRCAGFEDYEVG